MISEGSRDTEVINLHLKSSKIKGEIRMMLWLCTITVNNSFVCLKIVPDIILLSYYCHEIQHQTSVTVNPYLSVSVF